MINWKNLEKFIAPGKVVTLVLLVDGEEVGAFSFNVDSLAFKEALEAASHLDPVKVAEKKSEPLSDAHKKFHEQADKALGRKKSEPKSEPKPELEPMDDEEKDDEDDNDVSEEEEKGGEAIDKIFIPDKPMTREQIMSSNEPAQSDNAEVRANEHSGSKSAEQDGQPESANSNQLKLTDEW